uniref:Uncharacterized protein n=1 Tax=Physcomitrium patens TaxID=3218 RepID=A0A2K1IX87_PHYPA|nr:hypothetical protein PHYPA_023709 [Physcomitrium patens]
MQLGMRQRRQVLLDCLISINVLQLVSRRELVGVPNLNSKDQRLNLEM